MKGVESSTMRAFIGIRLYSSPIGENAFARFSAYVRFSYISKGLCRTLGPPDSPSQTGLRARLCNHPVQPILLLLLYTGAAARSPS